MKLQLLKALNRQRLRRKLAQERALLAEMRENAANLIEAKRCEIDALQARLGWPKSRTRESSADIARRIDRQAKAELFAA